MRRSYAPVLLAGLLAGAIALGGITGVAAAQSGTPAASDHVLRVDWGSFPDTFDPQKSEHWSQTGVSYLDYEGLTRIDEHLATVPAAAESWEFSDDGLTLIFHLRQNLTYADGTPLTAERFRYAIERTCDPRTEAPYASVLFDIAGCELLSATDAADAVALDTARGALGVEALDDRTLRIQLLNPAAYFPTVASLWVLYPVQQEAVEANPEGWWKDPASRVGNGPFRMTTVEPVADVPTTIAFAANERYWGGHPALDGVEYVILPEGYAPGAGLELYKRGELDMAYPPAEIMPGIESDPVLSQELLRYTVATTEILFFNLDREPFQDKKVREAFAYAFDREAFCRELGFGTCTATLSWIPEGVPGHIETDAYAFDPERARQALAESSYGGPAELPEIFWDYVADDPPSVDTAEWFAAQFREVLGVELTLRTLSEEEIEAQFDDPATWPQVDFWSWVQDYPDPQNWLSTFWTCDSTVFASKVGYCNEEFDALVARADAEFDAETRLALYEEAGQMLVADAPAIFLDNPFTQLLVKPYVTGYTVTSIDQYFPGQQTPLTIDVERAG
jgi:oligopeptide transport system substrate-binding protein